jgi:multiple sugar transport system ATP-binding protein
MTMGDRVAVLRDGQLQQCDTPRNLYDTPANAFVAGFIGSPAMNLRTSQLVPGGARLGNIVLPLQSGVSDAARTAGLSTITLGVRPESFAVAANGGGGLRMEVKLVEELGADAFVYGSLPDDDATDKHFIVRFDGRVPPRIGEILDLDVRSGEAHAFNPETGERVG